MTKPAFTYPRDEPLIVFERVFAAPPALVWRAHTDPAMMAHWWGPRYLRNEVLEMDVRPGGAWRINQHAPDGTVHPFKGVYSKVVPFEQLDYTFAYADYPPVPITMRLEDLGDGRTRMLSVTDMGTMEARQGMLDAGMEWGALEGFSRLDTLLSQDKFKMVRRVAAPRALVWKAFTELDRLAQWWGPVGFEWLGGELDLRPGGVFRFGMAAPDGSEMWARFAYKEVQPVERLSYAVAFTDRQGAEVRAAFDPNFPVEYLSLVSFAEEGGATVVTIEAWAVSEDEAELAAFSGLMASMQQGFGATLDQLETYLDQLGRADAPFAMTLERIFAAPRELVFRAWADPQRFVQWWGPKGLVVEICDFDPRPGSVLHIAMRLPDGQLHHIRGRFTEVEAPALIAFEGEAITEAGEVLVGSETRVAFADDAGGTRLTLVLNLKTPVGPSDLRQMKESWVEILEKLAVNVSEAGA